ncbi:cysteine desulfurase family protein, partial [Pseudoalteromonas byunsanensis]
IFYSPLEHSATIENVEYYQKKGIETVEIAHLKNGLLDLSDLQKKLEGCSKKNSLVAVMAAHNETGVIQNYQQIGALCHRYNAQYYCDTTQLIGKVPFDFEGSNIDYAVGSGHKFGALPGTGFLLIGDPWRFNPLMLGGGQEHALRAGTQNYLGIYSLAIALKAAHIDMQAHSSVKEAQQTFERALKEKFPASEIFGEDIVRVPGITFCSIAGLKRNKILNVFDQENILVTSGSACSDKKNKASKTALHLGYDEALAQETIRISLGLNASKAHYDRLLFLLEGLALDDLVA